MINSTMDVVLVIIIILMLISLAGLIHYNGYKAGFKIGVKKGCREINKYVLRINESQNERIIKLTQELNLQKSKRGD